MIYVGYQGIGKSSIAGWNNCIDLESNNFRVNNKKDANWHIVYCNIAEQLSLQGYNVFISIHKIVREELIKRGIEFTVIVPSLDLKDKWLEKLQNRYDNTGLEKDYLALKGAENYENRIKELLEEQHVIVIKDMDYDLKDLIK